MRRVTLRSFHLALALAGGLTLIAQPASATAFCNVKETADGFVALRAAPDAKAKLVGRMSADDEVMIGLGKKGSWVEVNWYRGDERHTKGFGAVSGRGWVNSRLIDEECG
jgi:hypothetical protein